MMGPAMLWVVLVGDGGGDDGSSDVVGGLGLQDAGPHVTIVASGCGQGASLITITISMGQLVVNVEIKETVCVAVSTIEVNVDLDGLAVCPGEECLHVSHIDAVVSSLGSVCWVNVLDTNVNTQQVDRPVQSLSLGEAGTIGGGCEGQ